MSRCGTDWWNATAPAGTHRFVHALVQEVVLQELTAGHVARLHATVAEQLERAGTSSPAALAEHWWAAREIVGLRAVPSQVAAANAAASVFAHEQAEVHLRRALHLVRNATPPDPDTELSLLLSLFTLILTARGWGDSGRPRGRGPGHAARRGRRPQ